MDGLFVRRDRHCKNKRKGQKVYVKGRLNKYRVIE